MARNYSEFHQRWHLRKKLIGTEFPHKRLSMSACACAGCCHGITLAMEDNYQLELEESVEVIKVADSSNNNATAAVVS